MKRCSSVRSVAIGSSLAPRLVPRLPRSSRAFALVLAGGAFAVALLALPGSASAQGPRPAPGATSTSSATAATTTTSEYSEKRQEGSAVVVFKEDTVGAGGAGAFGGTILTPPGATRVGLLRPRFNFVSEMLKSVENL